MCVKAITSFGILNVSRGDGYVSLIRVRQLFLFNLQMRIENYRFLICTQIFSF
jgi:hypothetical protein